MKKASIVLAIIGAAAFIASMVKNVNLGPMSLQYASALVYSLGVYLFVAYSQKDKSAPNAIMVLATYATLWAYSLVTALDGDINEPILTLAVLMPTIHSILILINNKTKLTGKTFFIIALSILIVALALIAIL